MSVLRSSYGQRALPAHGFSAHAACSLVRAARTSYPRGHGGSTEDVEVGITSFLTSFSVDGEHTSITFSEATQSLSNGLRGDPNDRVLEGVSSP
jgi:hypothetical protein